MLKPWTMLKPCALLVLVLSILALGLDDLLLLFLLFFKFHFKRFGGRGGMCPIRRDTYLVSQVKQFYEYDTFHLTQ